MSLSSHQQKPTIKPSLDSGQSRLALISYLTQKKESSSLFKKKAFLWDQERLYSQNLTLRSQIKDLTDANTKSKTRILEMQALMKTSQIRTSEKETPLRSLSLKTLNKKPLALFRTKPQDEEARYKTMRQIVRELREQITALKNQNMALKRSMKFTRMNELQALNTEMEIELQRLNTIAVDAKNKYYCLALQLEGLKNNIKRQSGAKKQAIHEKNKLQNEIFILQKEREVQDRKLRQEIKKTRVLNPQLNLLPTRQTPLELNSIPKLEYSISGFDGDTINFDRLIGTESQIKSIPKLASLTSLQILNKQSLAKYELSLQPMRKVRLNEMNTPPVPQNDYDYEPEEIQIEQQKNKKNENPFLPLETKKLQDSEPKKQLKEKVQKPSPKSKVKDVPQEQVKKESDYEDLIEVEEEEQISNAKQIKKETKDLQIPKIQKEPIVTEQAKLKKEAREESDYQEIFEDVEAIEEIEDV